MKLIKNLLLISFINLLFVSVLSAGSISGKITEENPSGNVGVEGALVFAFNIAGIDSLGFSATTDSEGNYLLDNLPAGEYEIVAQMGNLFGSYSSFISLNENDAVSDINITINDAYGFYDNEVSGTIKDENNNPIIDAEIEMSIDGEIFFVDYSWNDGTFNISNLMPGEYTLTIFKFGYEKYVYASTITVTDNSKTTGLAIILTKLESDASLEGTITNSYTSAPLKDVELYLYGETLFFSGDSLGEIVTSDENGKYKIDNLISGKYWYFANLEGYESAWGEVDVNGTTTLDIELKQMVAGTIEGVVLDVDGNPVPDTFIDFIPADEENYNYGYAITDANGKYSSKVAIGDYYVSCYTKGLDSSSTDPNNMFPMQLFYDNAQNIKDAKIVSVKENETQSGINFVLPSMEEIEVVISGTVKDDKGNSIENATVEVWIDGYFYICADSSPVGNTTTTDANGNYSLTISQKAYGEIAFTVLAYKEGYADEYYNEQSEWYLADLLVASGNETKTDINFTLTNESELYANSISGTVSDKDGNGLENVFVAAYSANGYSYEEGQTDENGNYKISNLKNEDYIITFYPMGNYIPEIYDDVLTWEEATEVKANGDIIGINAILEEGQIGSFDSTKTVLGKVSDASGKAIANVVVVLKNSEGEAVTFARTDLNGNYSCATSSKSIAEAVVSRVGYESTTEELNKYSPVANTILLNISLNKSITDVEEIAGTNIPNEFELQQNFPNPFNPTTVITYSLPNASDVTLSVYNTIGEVVALLVNQHQEAGKFNVTFNANNLPSGIYFYSISAGEYSSVKKMMLLK